MKQYEMVDCGQNDILHWSGLSQVKLQCTSLLMHACTLILLLSLSATTLLP